MFVDFVEMEKTNKRCDYEPSEQYLNVAVYYIFKKHFGIWANYSFSV